MDQSRGDKTVLDAGVAGQDCAYLAELLLENSYAVPWHRAMVLVFQHRPC